MTNFDPFSGETIERSVDSTEAQREIWLVIKFGGDQASLAYNESITLALSGDIDIELLKSSAKKLLLRHDALRSTFSNDGQTMIVIANALLDFNVRDLRTLTGKERQSERIEARKKEVRRVFNLEQGPLIRFSLLLIADDHCDLIISAHHIICDGWSFGVLLEELHTLCKNDANAGLNMPLAPSFSDHAIADRKALYGPSADASERYWLDLLGEKPQELNLPTDRPRTQSLIDINSVPCRNLAALRVDRKLDICLTKATNDAAKSTGAGLSAMLLAIFAILLRRLSGQDDFIIGVPAAAQAHTGQYHLVGHCVQMLPIRIQCTGDTTVSALAKSIKVSLLDGVEHQDLTFGALLQRIRLQRDLSRIPLIPVMYNLDPASNVDRLGEYELDLISNPRCAENFEIFLNITPKKNQLTLEATFRTALFDEATIGGWLESYHTTLSNAVQQLDSSIDDINSLSSQQINQQLVKWNNTTRKANTPDTTIFSRIDQIARQSPERIAIQDQHESVSFQELLQRANRIANALIAAQIPVGSNIGICRDPSVNMLAGLLGIWKAQCAYIPLDPAYPEERLRYLIADTNISIILGQGEKTPNFAAACQWLTADGKSDTYNITVNRKPQANEVAYIIHTSGSTGPPKGVVIEHSALDNLISSMMRKPGMDASATMLAVTSLSFDISALELFLPLAIGAKVVLASREQVQDSFALVKLIEKCGADYMQATPSAWQALLDAGWQGNKQFTALCGGESLSLPLAQTLTSRVGKLWNLYGPTETTIWSTIELIPENPTVISIGRPIENTYALVLDNKHRLLPPGATGGELYLGGTGLARGYLGKTELTAKHFLINPFIEIPGERLYRTGDLARLDADGRIYFQGRKDNQVKIRGYRVELEEIGKILFTAGNVIAATAVIKNMTELDSRIVAYIVLKDKHSYDEQALRAVAARKLPPQCMPQHIIVLDGFPHTANGKIDYAALPDPSTSISEPAAAYTTDTQIELGKIWCELLRLNKIGLREDFFLLGGHSMLAVRLLARVREKFALELPLQSLFQDQNIATMAARIDLLQMHKESKDHFENRVTEEFEI